MIFKVKEPMFESEIRVYYGECPDKFIKAGRKGLEDYSIEFFDIEDCYAKTLIRGKWRLYYMWIEKAKDLSKIELMSNITHELCHIGASFVTSTNHEVSAMDELLPVFNDYYFKEICKRIWK